MGMKKAGRISLSEKMDRLAEAFVRMQAEMGDIRERMAEKTDISRILGAIDAFARKAENYDRKSFSHADILQEHEARLQSMDGRLKRLEAGT